MEYLCGVLHHVSVVGIHWYGPSSNRDRSIPILTHGEISMICHRCEGRGFSYERLVLLVSRRGEKWGKRHVICEECGGTGFTNCCDGASDEANECMGKQA